MAIVQYAAGSCKHPAPIAGLKPTTQPANKTDRALSTTSDILTKICFTTQDISITSAPFRTTLKLGH